MKTKPVKDLFSKLREAFILSAFFAMNYFADAQSVWNATVGVSADTNWSTAANWSPGVVPGVSSNVLFNYHNTVAAGTIDNVVDASTTIQQLAYKQTNGWHNTLILPGVTLTISNALAGTNLLAGTEAATTNNLVTNTISGSGGTLSITSGNTVSVISVREYTIGAAANSDHSVLDMSGLGDFNASIGNVWIGVFPGSTTSRPSGEFILARTNIISVLVAGTTAAPSIDVGDTGGSPDQNNVLTLGISNNIAADTIEIGNQRSVSTLKFNPAFTNSATPSLYLRGHTSSRVVSLNIGDDSGAGGVGSSSSGVVNFSGGTVDAMVGSMAVGNGQTVVGAGTATGTLTMTAGTLDVNTLEIGFEEVSGAVGVSTGTVNINGGTLTVNTSLRLARFLGGTIPTGTLNINGGTVSGNASIVAGGGTSTINLSGGTIAVSGAIGATAAHLSNFNITNSTLTLTVSAGATNVVANNLNIGGGNSIINISSLPSVSAYPSQFPLVTYTTPAGESDFVLGTLPGTFSGYILNDTVGTYWLVITNGPLPSKNVSWNGNNNGNWDTSTLNWLTDGNPTNYNPGDFVTFDDNLTGTTNVNLTTALNPGSITFNNNSVNYVLTGSGKIGGNIGLTQQGSGTVVIDNSGTNDFSGTVTISSGTIQIGNNDASGNLPALATVTDNGSLVFNRSNSITVLNAISGSGTVSQNNTNTLTLGGGNSYSGGLNVNAGTLRLTTANAQGTGNIAVNTGGALITAASISNPITLADGALGASASVTYSGDVTAQDSTANTIYTADPQNPGVLLGSDSIFTGTLHGSGNITVVTGSNTPNPDAGNGFRLRGTSSSDFTGAITLANSVKGELQTTVSGPFSPAGTGKIILTCGTYAADYTTNGTYSELNVRDNSSGDTAFGNDIELSGSGLALMNPLGTAPVGAIVTMGNLKIGNGQQLGVHLNNGNVHKVFFPTVTLNGGNATLSPKVPGLGTNGVGSDLQIGDVSELTAGSGITMGGLRTLTLTGNNTYSGNTIITSGTLALSGNSDLSNSPAISIAAGAILDVSARSNQTLTLTNNAILAGNGTLNGNLVVSPGTTFSPGATGGVFTVTSGSATLEGLTLMKINRTGSGQTNSILNAGTIYFGGTLTVSNLTTAPVAGDSYQLFAGSYSGSFAATNLPALGAGLAWDATTLGTDGTLRVLSTSQPQPRINSVTLVGTNLVISGTNGTTSGNYYVLASTNVALPLAGWTPVATNAFSGGNFIFTNAITPGVSQQFYLLRLP